MPVCFFRVEYGKALMILTDYTEHPLLPFLEGDGRPAGKASIITTLWDEHCQTAQDIHITAGDLVYLKNLRPKVDTENKIELAMNGRKSQYELHLIEQNTELAQQNLRPRNQEHGGASGQPQPTQPTRPQSAVPLPKVVQPPKVTQPSSTKPQTTSIFPISSTSKVPQSAKVSSTPVVPVGSSSNMNSADNSAATRSTPPSLQDIELVPTIPLKREPTSPIAVSMDSGNSPTHVLINKLKQAIRNNNAEGLRYVKLGARVVGYEPENLLDFSCARCTRCAYKYLPMSKQKLTPRCPGCSRDGVSKFEYAFQLKLLDELGQAFFVDVDNEHATTLIGTGAGNMLKNEALLKKVTDRLALIGVSNTWDQDKIIYFDCCVRQHIGRDNQGQTAGSGNKRSGSPIPDRGTKRLAQSTQEANDSASQELSSSSSMSSQQSVLASTTIPIQAPSRLTWSLVFTEIK
ncbi:hypothetical protein BGZ95_010949 [Linnemannia exigua]|uniref:Protection of telomeres protein 1 ssDNA-binding domain-containing protein n=1 Tax=Linnemannia exigua TaxID=604196 RepID=A0AAD4HA77_9FUNG|nr:hypothetical protein BGZ95_010949 [Linnemannia exigua]